MKKIYPDLWQTTLEHPFVGLNSHAYFLKRELQRGKSNVLFYNTSSLDDIEEISKLGGISYQYLSHRHESGPSLATIKASLQSQLCVDEIETPFIETAVDKTFSTRQMHNSSIDVIPTPGHTAGGLCFYYESPGGLNYLFTGDTLFQSSGQWSTLVLKSDGGNVDNLVASLRALRALKPDVVLCSASVGDTSVVEITHAQWRDAIDTNISSLSKG